MAFPPTDDLEAPRITPAVQWLIAINVAWQTGLVLAADRLRRWLGRLSVQRVIAIVTGLVFIGFAALLLVEHVLPAGRLHAMPP